MNFSDTSNNDGIVQMIERTTKLGLATVSGDSDLLAYFTNLINQAYTQTGFWIMHSSKDWLFDDSNHTDFPIATTTLVDDQRDYQLPTSLLRIKKVEIKDSDGDYYELDRMDTNDPRLQDEYWQEDSGQPAYYYPLGRSIVLYPAVDSSEVTTSAGMRITFDRELDYFTTSDTTQEPGFAEQFHPILYYLSSMEWAEVNEKPNIAGMCQRKVFGSDPIHDKGLKKQLEQFYSEQDENDTAVLKPNSMNINYE